MINETGEDKPKTVAMPKSYKIRSDGAVLLPESVLAMVGWKPGDEISLTVDVTNNKLTMSVPDGR